MKRRISLLLCVLIAVFTFTACGSTTEQITYDEEALKQTSEMLLQTCSSLSADPSAVDYFKSQDEFNLNLSLASSNFPGSASSLIAALDSWNAAVDECGEFVENGDYTVTEKNGEIKVSTDAKFAERTATITFAYDEKSRLQSMTVDANFEMGEILQKAGLNTLLGMGTVFAVLIFISLIISLFKYIPAIEAKFKNKGAKTEEVKASAPAVQTPVAEEEDEDDLEIVAAIAAAIAMQEGKDPSGFVVRSIRRRPSNKWAS